MIRSYKTQLVAHDPRPTTHDPRPTVRWVVGIYEARRKWLNSVALRQLLHNAGRDEQELRLLSIENVQKRISRREFGFRTTLHAWEGS